jgi:hypothetical protein
VVEVSTVEQRAALYLPGGSEERPAMIARTLDYCAAAGLHLETVCHDWAEVLRLYKEGKVGTILVPLRQMLPDPPGVVIVDEHLQRPPNGRSPRRRPQPTERTRLLRDADEPILPNRYVRPR